MTPKQKRKYIPFNWMPARAIAVSFAAVILLGTLLLMLPASSADGRSAGLVDALFTATSATCVTGLAVRDTATGWSMTGQMIILALIQIGGLGLVTFTTFFNVLMGKKLGLRSMQLARESINITGFENITVVVRLVVMTSLLIELLGAVLLSGVLVPRYGARGIYLAMFLSVSAFCNAGMDPLGFEEPYASLTRYAGSPFVLCVIMTLIVVGGLGFVVWADFYRFRETRRLALHTRVVLLTTALLIAAGALGVLLLEWANPATLGPMGVGEKGMNALFSSITARTAGFNTIDIPSMGGLSKLLICGLMFIGAAPGSTGGGIKVTTVTVILMTVICVVRGRDETVILGRRVSREVVYKTLAVFVIAMLAVGVSGVAVYEIMAANGTPVTGIDAFFEVVSAFATVGLSSGVTAAANLPARLILILSMYLGRVGPVSFALALAMRPPCNRTTVLPEGTIMVG